MNIEQFLSEIGKYRNHFDAGFLSSQNNNGIGCVAIALSPHNFPLKKNINGRPSRWAFCLMSAISVLKYELFFGTHELSLLGEKLELSYEDAFKIQNSEGFGGDNVLREEILMELGVSHPGPKFPWHIEDPQQYPCLDKDSSPLFTQGGGVSVHSFFELASL